MILLNPTSLFNSGLCFGEKKKKNWQNIEWNDQNASKDYTYDMIWYDMQYSKIFSTFPHQAPCRKLLNTVLRGLELTIFQSDRDIYIPNCDTRGFYRKKQVFVDLVEVHNLILLL